ncbi:MAG: NAD+ synthase [Betaproteobacteria bacterium]|nr:NAD+ synthase [Betaproteobacteria bacterium]
MKFAIAQLNQLVGDLPGNARRIREAAERAHAAGVRCLLTPELSLCGYPPEDLVMRPAFLHACRAELDALARDLPPLAVVVGFPLAEGGFRYNAAAWLEHGAVTAIHRKQRLPNYTVFDEQRYFTPGPSATVVALDGIRVGILICEDVWFPEPAAQAREAGADVMVVLNGSPFHTMQQQARRDVVAARARETSAPIVYCNQVGGQDELVFDGASFVVDGGGALTQQLPAFHEALAIVEFAAGAPKAVRGELPGSLEANVYQALCLGVRDYIGKNNFPGALLGLSGGVDSALTLAIAVDALGAERVRALMLPSRYNASISLDDARDMARLVGVRYDEIAIEPMFQSMLGALAGEFRGRPADATEENLQARIRGMILMALSNKFGSILLTTGNKSEMAVGYATLYGDMAGGFGVLKDISKTLVYRLCAYRNALGRVIPERIITRAPSAELRENQTDQDNLPPYDQLDAILEAYVERDQSPADIIAAGIPEEAVKRVVRLIHFSEYKRRQSAVGIRITPRGFGKDWRYPITSRWREWEHLGGDG